MLQPRSWLLAAALPLFAGCQLLDFTSSSSTPQPLSGQSRMQGNLSAEGGHLLFTPCDSPRTFVVADNGDTGITQEAATLASLNKPLFADLRGRFDGNKVSGQPGELNLQKLYRIESSATACQDRNFKLMQFQADGQGWEARVNTQGLLVERDGQAPFAVPFVEEQGLDGAINLTSDANHQHIQLWLAPQRCEAGARVSFMAAELRVGEQVLRGCAFVGGAREQ
ncbi:hypothetical protein [Pseudomonas sp. KNUC1026]|uniref:hypothetical protein n=1 Tax=Pseudomonas sp. KNUC1026 TaxID=2893890 RepID=UPI001F2B1515|nr:hypothetical protein [Pseudomonas sp. KNUC1026]UFH50630.1 hypothetical protein LN139_05455 [Pseudomonas sp. KNUC1026]